MFALNCEDENISKEAVAEVLVMSDTTFELSAIHPAFSGDLAYFLYNPEACAFVSNPDLHYTSLYSFDCSRGIYNNYQGGTGWTNEQVTMALAPLTGQIQPVLSAYQVNQVNDPNTDHEVAWTINEYSRFVDGERVLIRRDSIPSQ